MCRKKSVWILGCPETIQCMTHQNFILCRQNPVYFSVWEEKKSETVSEIYNYQAIKCPVKNSCNRKNQNGIFMNQYWVIMTLRSGKYWGMVFSEYCGTHLRTHRVNENNFLPRNWKPVLHICPKRAKKSQNLNFGIALST